MSRTPKRIYLLCVNEHPSGKAYTDKDLAHSIRENKQRTSDQGFRKGGPLRRWTVLPITLVEIKRT